MNGNTLEDTLANISKSIERGKKKKIIKTFVKRKRKRKIKENEMAKLTGEEWHLLCETQAQNSAGCSNGGVEDIKVGEGITTPPKCKECVETFCKHKEMTYLEKHCFPGDYAAHGGKRGHIKQMFQKIDNCSDGDYVCLLCGNFFTSEASMAMHQLTHGTASSIEPIIKVSKPGTKHQCVTCNISFPSEFHLVTHTKRFHHRASQQFT